MQSSQPISKSDLQQKFRAFKDDFDQSRDTLPAFIDFLNIFNQVNQDPVQTVYQNPELKKFFFEEFVGGITKRITSLKGNQPEVFTFLKPKVTSQYCTKRDNSDMADSMRCIFDQTSPLYQNYFQSDEALLSSDDPNLMLKISAEDREWRLSLKEGYQIDAIKIEPEYNLKSWAKAKIVSVLGDGSYFHIEFENEPSRMSRDLTRYSLDIARYNQMSEGDEWRSELKVGDLIDGFDSTKIWYASTVVNTQVLEVNDKIIPQVQVGFRIYHPEGNKEDEKTQKKFFGWSERFDEWLSCYNPRIQKFQSLAKSIEQPTANSSEETLDDQMDQLLYSNNKINQTGEDSLSLECVFYYLDCLANCQVMLNKVFLLNYVPQLYQAVRTKMLNATETQLRNIKKDRIDGIVNNLIGVLFNRIHPFKQRDVEKNFFNFEIGCKFLTQNFLERRIDGAKLIQEVCKNSNSQLYQYSSETIYNYSNKQQIIQIVGKIIAQIKQNNVLFEMFSKDRTHLQLVKRSEELLKLLMTQNALSEEELEQVWSCTKSDEATKLELYKVLNELAPKMKEGYYSFFIEQLLKKNKTDIIHEEIELVHEMGKRQKSGTSAFGDMAVQFMWKLAFSKDVKLDKALVSQAGQSLTDIIKYWSNDHKLKYFEALITNIKQNYEGLLSIKMMMRILRDFSGEVQVSQPENTSNQNENQMETDQSNSDKFISKPIFIEYLVQEYGLMQAFFSNFEYYLTNAEREIELKLQQDPTFELNQLSDKILFDKFIHSEQLNERLDFIKYIGSSSSVKISQQNLIFIWHQLVQKSQIQADQEMFYRWLKELCDIHTQYNCVVDINDLISFFKNYLSESESSLRHLTTEGFNCIQSFFLLINENSGKIRKLNASSSNSNQTHKFTSYSNNGVGQYNNFSFNQNKTGYYETEDIDIMVNCDPSNLEGLEGIWRVATENSTKMVQDSASNLLIKLYTNVDFELERQIPQFEEQFIQRCIDEIKNLHDIIKTRAESMPEEVRVQKNLSKFSSTSVIQKQLPLEERKIIRFMALLRDIIKNSEREGTFGVVPHSALFKGEYLPFIQVSNSVKNGNKYLNKLEIGCFSNVTLWELRKMVGERAARIYNEDGSYFQEASVHPTTIRLYRLTGAIDLKESDNGRTLGELKFKSNETISAYKRNTFVLNKAPLIQSDGETLTEAARKIFQSWFYRFSIPDPECPDNRIMTKSTCTMFIRSCTDDNCSEEDNRVTKLFSMCDPQGDGKVNEQGFLEFYRQSSKDKEDVVRQNLFAHGYRYDLKKAPEDGSDDNIMQIRPSKEEMPRFKIANKDDWFDIFFNLLYLGNEVSNTAWTFIKYLTTSPSLYSKILKLEKNEDFKWENIFDNENIYKMLYSLQIVESLLEEDQQSIDIFSEQGQLKKDWIERFLTLGGFNQILNQFNIALKLMGRKQADQMNKYEKNFLEQMLKMIRIFMMAAFTSTDDQFSQTLDLIKNVSKNSENEFYENNDQNDPNFKTPKKQQPNQIGLEKKEVKFNKDVGTGPEITEEMLFGPKEFNFDLKKTEEPEENKVSNTNLDLKQPETQVFEQSQRFSELASIMKQNGLGQQILNQIDYNSLQNEMLEVISLILAKKEISNEDKLVVDNSLGLWLACLLKDNTLIDEFYKFTRKSDSSVLYGVKNAETFITQGLFTYKNLRVREEFMNTLVCISKQVKKNNGVKPIFFILELLSRNFPREDLFYATRECKQFFELFQKLIEQYYEQPPDQPEQQFDIVSLFKTTIEKLQRYESKEKKTSLLEDNALIGYMGLIEKLMTNLTKHDRKRALKVLEETNFVDEIFYENLFYHPDKTKSATENKCKTKEARPVGFNLLQKYVEILEPKELAEFLENYVWNLIKNIERPKKWKYVSQEGTKNQAYSGIVNLGCICYMNSMIQQFFMIPTFRYQLLRALDNSPPDIKEYKGMKIDDNLLKQLQKMFGFLELTERQAYDPTEFCFACKDQEGNPTNTAIQQDAQEFLNIFFDRLEQCLSHTSQKKLLDTIYGGNLCSQLICMNCGKIGNRLEGFMNLSLPVKDRKSLEDSLDKMVELGIINDFFCENCQQRVDIQKRSLIAETPNILIVHLQRFVFNFDTFLNDKVNTRFEFPTVLNLKEFSFKEVMRAENRPEEEMMNEQVKHLMDIPDDEYIFKLVGVTIHEGTAEHGHYYSLINIKRNNDDNDENSPEWLQTEKQHWRVFEDDKIKPYSFSDMKVDAFGGSNSSSHMDNDMSQYYANSQASFGKNAYMLVYEKKKKHELKEYIKLDEREDEEMKDANQIASVNAEATLDCANTATSRAAGDHQTSSVGEGSNANQEVIRLVDFKKVQPYIPDWIRKLVQEDNTSFVMDKHLYHETFFNMIKGILKHVSHSVIYTQHQFPYEYSENFVRVKKACIKIAKKVMFDMLAYYNMNTQMNDINSSLSSIITFCDSYLALQRGEESILLDFLNEAYLNDNCSHFFSIMLNCPDKTSRYYIGKMTTNVINKVFSLYQEATDKEAPKVKELYEAAQKFMYLIIITLQSQDCQKNWSRLEHYFKMIYEIGIAGPGQAHYLLTKFDIVVELIDFILGNKSPKAIQRGEKRPNMGAGQSQPPFEQLVALICYLIRFSMTPEMKNEKSEWNQPSNPPPSTLLGYPDEESLVGDEKYPLSEEAFIYFTNQDFIDKVLKEGYECEELGKALAHFCYKNEKFTKKVSQLLLKGISRNDYEKIKNYLDVVTQVALIRDEFQRTRLEWMFGFGTLISQTSYVGMQNLPQTKLGVQLLNSLNDEVYEFRSSLINDSNDDALLHLLWRYKGRMDIYTINCLYSLVNLISQDEKVAEYFSELPGPNYTLARYTDWIKPYLNQQLSDARKGYSGSLSSNKEEVIVKTLSLYEKYESYLAQKDNVSVQQYAQQEERKEEEREVSDQIMEQEDEENVRNLIKESDTEQRGVRTVEVESRNVIPCQPQPYVIVECIDETTLKEDTMGVLTLQINQLSCLYTMSLPTGTNNLSIPKNRFKIRNSKFKEKRPSKLQMPNQAEILQNSAIQQDFVFQSRYNNNYESFDILKRHPDDRIINDDKKEWDRVNGKMNVSEDEEEISDQINQCYDDKNMGSDHDPADYINTYKNQQPIEEQESYKIQVIEPENQQPGVSDYAMKDEEPQNDGVPDELGEDETIHWPNEVLCCQNLVFKYTMFNNGDSAMKVNLKFMADPHNQGINLVWPRGGIKTQLRAKQAKTLILLPQIIPEQSEDQDPLQILLDYQCHWKEVEKKSAQNKAQVYPLRGSADLIAISQQTQSANAQGGLDGYQEDQEIEPQTSKVVVEENLPVPPPGQKSCPYCTTFNMISATSCIVCVNSI